LLLKRKKRATEQQKGDETSTESRQTVSASANLPPKDFFASLTSRINSTEHCAKPDEAMEVDAYLGDASTDLST